MADNFILMNYCLQKITQIIKKISIKSLFTLLKKDQAVVQKTSRKNVTSTVLISFFFFFFSLFDGRHEWKNHNEFKREQN